MRATKMLPALISAFLLCNLEAYPDADMSETAQLFSEVLPGMSVHEAKETINSKYVDITWGYGTCWPFLNKDIEAGLESHSSDFLYLLTRAASLNPLAAQGFLDALLSFEFRDFTGVIPPIDSERLALCSIDVGRYAPQAMAQAGWDGLSALLLFRNLAHSSVANSSDILSLRSQYFPMVIDNPRNDTLMHFSQDAIPAMNQLSTPNLTSFLSSTNHAMTDADQDGLPDSSDCNPIQRRNLRELSDEEQISSLAIQFKMLEEKEHLENLAVVVSPTVLDMKIHPVSGFYLLNITTSDRSLLDEESEDLFTFRWQPIYLLDLSLVKEAKNSPPTPCMPAQAVEYDVSGNFAQVIVAIDRPEHTINSHYIFFKNDGIWTLYDVILEGYTPCCRLYGHAGARGQSSE